MSRRLLLALWSGLTLLPTGCHRADDVLRIVVIPKGLTHEFWQSIHRGAVRAAADLGRNPGVPVEVIWDGPLRERDALAQIRIVDRRVSTRVDGLVLAPQHSQTMVPPVQRAVEQGVPVVVIDSGLEARPLFVKYVATDNYHGGVLAARRLLEVLKSAGKATPRVVLLRYQFGSESTDKREAGFKDTVDAEIERRANAGEPPITWLSNDKYAGSTKDSAKREAGPLIHQFTESDGTCRIDGLFAPNESSADGVLDVLRGMRLTGKVKLVGFDSSEPLLQAVGEGEVDGLILQDPYRMGYLGVWVMVQHLRGYEVVPVHSAGQPADGKNLSTGEFVITRENLHATTTRALFDPTEQARRTIATPPIRPRTPGPS